MIADTKNGKGWEEKRRDVSLNACSSTSESFREECLLFYTIFSMAPSAWRTIFILNKFFFFFFCSSERDMALGVAGWRRGRTSASSSTFSCPSRLRHVGLRRDDRSTRTIRFLEIRLQWVNHHAYSSDVQSRLKCTYLLVFFQFLVVGVRSNPDRVPAAYTVIARSNSSPLWCFSGEKKKDKRSMKCGDFTLVRPFAHWARLRLRSMR